MDKHETAIQVGGMQSTQAGYWVFTTTKKILACGEIREYLPTGFPQVEALSHQIHILEIGNHLAHIWGYRLTDIFSLWRTSPQRKPFIHR